MEERISHVRYISERVSECVDKYGITQMSYMMSTSNGNIRKFCSNSRMRVSTLEDLSNMLGLSVAELTLKPGLEDKVEWYRDSSIDYISDNLRLCAKEARIQQKELSRITGISYRVVNDYFMGKTVPMTDRLQALADALEVEIADLFLPVEEYVVS